MIGKENKVGAKLKTGERLDYSDTKQWNNIAIAAIEDIENGNNASLDALLTNIIAKKRYDFITGGISETLPFKRSELEKPKTEGMTNSQKNSRLVSNKKIADITEEFWQKEYDTLKSNILGDYEKLKNNIIDGKIKIKPKESTKRSKTNIVIRMIKALTPSFKSLNSSSNKNQVIATAEGELPIATKVIPGPVQYPEAVVRKVEPVKITANLKKASNKSIFRR